MNFLDSQYFVFRIELRCTIDTFIRDQNIKLWPVGISHFFDNRMVKL